MKRQEWIQQIKGSIHLLDGGYGANFFKLGYGDVPGVVLYLQAPEVVERLHRQYVEAGSDIILTNTFSANRHKLASLGYEDQFSEINFRAVQIARKAAGEKVQVFGNLSSLGTFPKPLGLLDFEEAISIFREQAGVLLEAGVDGFMVETMTDLKEMKAAILGIRSLTRDLPVITSMTFDHSLRSVTGTSVKIFATTLEDLDVDVACINCTLGPEEMLPVFQELSRYSTKLLAIEPNAGQPIYDGSQLTYNMNPERFALYLEDYVDLGANILGGCCGTSPDHIRVIKQFLKKRRPVQRKNLFTQALTSRTIYQPIEPFTIIGERINPASRKAFQDEIVQNNYHLVLKEAVAQEKEGATVLDVNLGIEKLLRKEHFKNVVLELDRGSSLPISFDIQTSEFMEAALREYPGRPLINSARVTEKSLEKAIDWLTMYGGMLILLAMDNQIPETAEARFRKIMEGIKLLEASGISRERVFADPLILSLGAKKDPRIALQTIHMLSDAGIQTVMGLSNLSFGLPERSAINGAYLAQAVEKGLKSAIMNPGDFLVMGGLKGSLTIRGDRLEEIKEHNYDNPLVDILLAGDANKLRDIVETKLLELSPIEICENVIGKAMEEIGELYNQDIIYLPHLLLASEIAQQIFEYLQSLTTEERSYHGKVVLASVEGDIHDIGKSIVGTVLKSGGFQVLDIGKDLPAQEIIKVVKAENPDILGLSAMMTSTVGRVEEIVEVLAKENFSTKLIAGGASMTASLASKFGCDGYAQNASVALELCKKLMAERNKLEKG